MAEADDAMRDEIADVVAQTFTDTETWNIWTIADALLPTVRAIVADELRAAADDAANSHVVTLNDGRAYRVVPVAGLYARADALDPR